jgi:hypothetical protein
MFSLDDDLAMFFLYIYSYEFNLATLILIFLLVYDRNTTPFHFPLTTPTALFGYYGRDKKYRANTRPWSLLKFFIIDQFMQ